MNRNNLYLCKHNLFRVCRYIEVGLDHINDQAERVSYLRVPYIS